MGQRHDDSDARSLVTDLSETSAEFRDVWARHEVAVRTTTRKRIVHSEVGLLDLDCDVVLSPPSGQRMVLFRAHPGTATTERLNLLLVLGTQTFADLDY